MTTKKKSNITPIFTVTVILAAFVGATVLTPKLGNLWDDLLSSNIEEKQEYRLDGPSQVLPLATVEPETRKITLETIANSKDKSLDKSRARYLLASDLLAEYKGGEALGYLERLEKDYALLAPNILLKRGRAYELTNDHIKAEKTWQELLEKYPTSFVAADALYKLGKTDPKYWQDAITLFPAHPRTHEIAYQLLKKDPKQLNLLLLLAKYDKSYQSNEILDRLVQEFSPQLKPEDWQIIGDSYWYKGVYNKVSSAYEKATATPENFYRIARAYDVTDNKQKAKSSYQKLIAKFPNAPETGLGLRRLANLSEAKEALSYLNQVINKFPEEAPEALIQKASILTTLGQYQQAEQTRNILINKYSNSEEAANYRWQVAKSFAESKNLLSAWQWAQEITKNNPNSDVTPKATFWSGKWAQQLGQNAQAKQIYEYTIKNYPQSYYAWRSAVQLGRNVGDFKTVRSITPNVVKPNVRPLPPGGSTTFKELFLLGQDQDAIDLFTAETAHKNELNVTEQFTQGLLEQIQGHNLKGINLIWSLKKKDKPQDSQEWEFLRKSPEYWQALFPFPFQDLIFDWSKKRQLNPLLVTSLIRQESRFEPEIKSPVGATGLMQVMPDTGKFIASQINLKQYSLTNPNDNVNLGTWYLDYTHKTYDNNSLLAVASYNAGPGNVSDWVKKYNTDDFDEFVENIPFRETKGYIETVFGNYWNYLRIYDQDYVNLENLHN